jgi:Popeye protein conserved region
VVRGRSRRPLLWSTTATAAAAAVSRRSTTSSASSSKSVVVVVVVAAGRPQAPPLYHRWAKTIRHSSNSSSRPSTTTTTTSSTSSTSSSSSSIIISQKRQRSSLSLSRQRQQQQQPVQQKSQQQQNQHEQASSSSSSSSSSSFYHQTLLRESPFWTRLDTFLRRPRSLPIPRYISPKFQQVTVAECFGHLSFLLVATSYAVDDFVLLRCIAVVASTCMLCFTYYHPHGRPLWLPFRWNVLFIALNTYRIGNVYWHQYWAQQIDIALIDFRNRNFYIMSPIDFAKLVRLARVEEYRHGDVVVTQGAMNYQVRLVLHGECRVLYNGALTYILEEANFISECGMHAGLLLPGKVESCCTIVATTPITTSTGEIMSAEQQQEQERNLEKEEQQRNGNNNNNNRKVVTRVLVWDRSELMHLLQCDASVRRSLEAAVSWDIVRKLKHQRSLVNHPELIHNAEEWTQRRNDQTQHRYTAILHNILNQQERGSKKKKMKNKGKNSKDDDDSSTGSSSSSSSNSSATIDLFRMQLAKYRIIHHIDEAHHNMALKECGWTPQEFATGVRQHRIRRVRTQFLDDDNEDKDDHDDHKDNAHAYYDNDDDDNDDDDSDAARSGWRWYWHDIKFRIFG